jgi:AraC-like DNA-binding protein
MAWNRRIVAVGWGSAAPPPGAAVADRPRLVGEAVRPVPGGTLLLLGPRGRAALADAGVRKAHRPPLVVALECVPRALQPHPTSSGLTSMRFDPTRFLDPAAPAGFELGSHAALLDRLVSLPGRAPLDPGLWLPRMEGDHAGMALAFAAAVERCPVLDARAVAAEWGRAYRTCDRYCTRLFGATTAALLWQYVQHFARRERARGTPLADIAAMLGFADDRALRRAFARRGVLLPPRLPDLARTNPGLANSGPYPDADSDRRIPPARSSAGDRAGEPEFDGAGPPLS